MSDKRGWNEVAPTLLVSILHLVERAFSREKTRDKYLVLDEAWTLLQSEDTAEFFVGVAKTYRKLRASLVVVTQQIEDLKGPMGQKIIKEAKTRLCLQQPPEAVEFIREQLGLTDAQAEAFRRLKKRDGLYSEVLVLASKTQGIARIVPSSLEYWAYTTSAQDNALLESIEKEFEEQGQEDATRKAIALAAQKYPRGLPHEASQPPKTARREEELFTWTA